MEVRSIHCHVSNLSRQGKRGILYNAVFKASYNAGERLWCEREQRWADYRYKKEAIFREIMAPPSAEGWTKDRSELWNKVDIFAKRKDSRLSKNISCAICYQIPQDQWALMLREYAQIFVDMGCVADLAIHEDGTGENPHIHLMLTVNQLKPDGFGKKIDGIELQKFVKTARRGWQDISNKYLQANGIGYRVDARSLKARGIARIPERHRGMNMHERALKRQRAQNLTRNRPLEPVSIQERTMSDKENPYRKIPKNHEYLSHEEEIPAPEHPKHDYAEIDRLLERELEEELDRRYDDHLRNQAGTDRTKAEHREHDYNNPSMDDAQWETFSEAREQALHLEPTQQEIELKQAFKDAPTPVRREIDEQIMHQRTERILAQQEAERLQYLQNQASPEQLRLLEQYQASEEPHRHDLLRPEPGPDNVPYSRSELRAARDKMIADYEREEERER